MSRRKLFDKKSSVRFRLVHRSQRDPLAADESAPQMVFVDVNDDNHRKDEQKKYGVYFDDNYDYLQQMKDVDPTHEWQPIDDNNTASSSRRPKPPKVLANASAVQLPSSLFASAVEEKEGLLNKAVLPVGPQPDWDPEVVAAMDEDFDFNDPNNQIDDDFILQAEGVDDNEGIDGNDDDDDQWEDVSDEEDDDSTVCGSGGASDTESDEQFSGEETKSHFTNYSMSSSVMRRNQNLTLLDQRFETLYETEYANECDIGSLDFDDIGGTIDTNNSELMAHLVNDFKQMKNQKHLYETIDSKDLKLFLDNKHRNESKEDKEELTEVEIFENSKNREKDGFDCESIISTYSNLYNRPKIITEKGTKYPQRLKINERTGLPIGIFEKPGLTAKKLAKLDAINAGDNDLMLKATKSVRSSASRISELSVRPTNETPEQRRQRKAELKEYRRERRVEKKANKEAFKTEDQRLHKEVLNLNKSLNAVKLL